MNQSQELTHIPKDTADALDHHEKVIRAAINGQRLGAAQQFGFAYVAGREFLAAKLTLAHGNSHASANGEAANAGLQKFAERFTQDEVTYRTCQNWMIFSEQVDAAIADGKLPAAVRKRHTPVLRRDRVQKRDIPAWLQIVPLVMDGKGMMKFMRDSRLLRDPLKPKHHPRKKIDAEQAKAAKLKLATRHWENVAAAQDLGEKLLKLLPRELLQRLLDRNVATNDLCRQFLKAN